MTKDERIDIFNDTIEYSRKQGFESESRTYRMGDFNSTVDMSRTNIEVVNTDTVSAAQKYSALGRTALLNMASYKRPGGGVRSGAQAQEECLFRCSNLGDAIPTDSYPLDLDDGIYTRDAHFFKDFYYGYIEPFKVDVITVAAINLREQEIDPDYYEETVTDKMRFMLSMAKLNNVENVILGAWGCGVFKNDPTEIAEMFADVIETHFKDSFTNIIFAVINDDNSVDNNYTIFEKTFSGVCI